MKTNGSSNLAQFQLQLIGSRPTVWIFCAIMTSIKPRAGFVNAEEVSYFALPGNNKKPGIVSKFGWQSNPVISQESFITKTEVCLFADVVPADSYIHFRLKDKKHAYQTTIAANEWAAGFQIG